MLRKTAVVLAGLLAMSNMAMAADWAWDSPTVNNWRVVQAEGTLQYQDGDVVGTNGSDTFPEPAAISPEKGGTAVIASPGTLHVIGRPSPDSDAGGSSWPNWSYGLYIYSSVSTEVQDEVTDVTFDTGVDVDMISAGQQRPDGRPLSIGITVSAHGSDGVAPEHASETRLTMNKDVKIHMVNRTENSTSSSGDGVSVYGMKIQSFKEGRNKVLFNGDLAVTGTVETENKAIVGISLQNDTKKDDADHVRFMGNVNVDVESLHGGAITPFDMVNGGTMRLETAEGKTFSIRGVQAGGSQFVTAANFSCGVKDGSRILTGDQKVRIGGKAHFVSEGEFYINGLNVRSNYGSDQQVEMADDVSIDVKARDWGLGFTTDGKNAKSRVDMKKRLDINVVSDNYGYGIYSRPGQGQDAEIRIEGPSRIAVESGAKFATGVESAVTGGGSNLIHFKGGLETDVASRDANTMLLDANTDGSGSSVIRVDGDSRLMGTTPRTWIANVAGQGALVDVNSGGGGRVQADGMIFVKNGGATSWNLDTANSLLKSSVTAKSGGKVDIRATRADAGFEGRTSIGDDQAGNVAVTLDNGGFWRLTDHSTVNSLSVDRQGLVDMTHDSGFQVLVAENITGEDGMFRMDIDAGKNTDNSDRIYVPGTFTGQQYIDLNEVGHGNLDGAEGTVLATVNDNQGTFLAKDGEGTLYWNRYDLDKKATADTSGLFTTDWYLKKASKTDRPTTSVTVTGSSDDLLYHTWRSDMDKLLQRVGELRQQADEPRGLWVRMRGDKIRRNGDFSFTHRYQTWQIGHDWRDVKVTERDAYAGVGLTYSKGDSEYARGGGDTRSLSLGIYRTEISPDGHYLDLVLQGGRFSDDFTVTDTQGKKISGKDSRKGISLSGEYGQKHGMGHRWYVEPQAQLRIGYLGSGDYTLSNGARVHNKGVTSAVARAGFNLGKELGEKGILYAKANVFHEFAGDTATTLREGGDRVRRERKHHDTWFQWGLGTSYEVDENSCLYFDVEKSAGGSFRRDWQWNVGARFTFN